MRVRIGRGGGERWSLTLILLLAALLRLWRVGEHGYGNLYYAAGVRSMLLGGRNPFFGAFDPAGFVSVDKPPVAFWLQAASAWLLGFSGRSLMLPQALGGVVAVAVVYHVTRHAWGPGAALLAALTLAITPIAVDRVNSTDSLLVLVLVLAAWPALRAVETGRLCPLLTAMALVGVAFNVKMLAAYVVLPAFVLLYLLAAPVPWCRRLGHLAVAGGVLVIVSLSWSLAVDLTPPSARPYVGDSHNNTEMNLIFGYNGIARLVAGRRWALSGRRGPWADGGPRMTAPPDGVAVPSGAGVPTAPATTASGVGTGALGGTVGTAAGGGRPAGRGHFGGGEPGPLRLADHALAGDVTWLFPLAAIGLLAGRPRPRLDDPRHQAVLFWAIWFACGVIVFSFAHGMFRPYYVVMLAPALAALVGIGLAALWRSYREPGWPSALLPAALLTTAAWQGYVLREYRDWGPILTAIAVGGGLVAALGLLLLWIWLAAPLSPRWPQAALARGLIALMASPAAWAVTPALVGTASGVPAAGPELLTRGLGPGPGGFAAREADVRRLVDFLRAHRHGERYLLATANAMQASPIIVQTGEPVMAIGGWSGGDPILTQAQFAGLVVEGHVRYVLVPEPGGRPGPAGAVGPWGGGRPTGPANGSADGSDGGRNGPLFRWVVEHGRRVDPTLWQAEVPAGESDRAMPRAVYDCRPDATEAASKQEGSE